MVQLSQIYEKSVRKVLAFFGLILLLNSCASKSTSLFELQNQSVLNESKQTSNPTIQIEKKSVYILGIFTTGEYDRFEGNIFDQLRISLYSEARYKYPEYELTNVSQEESYRFFKTTYSVKGQLVSNKQMRERLHLISGALAQFPPSEPYEAATNTTTSEETQVEELVVSDQKSSTEVASTQEVLKMFETVVNQEPSEIIEPVTIAEEPQIEEIPVSIMIDEEPIVLNEVSPLMGKTVYIVASFPRQGFVEEKVKITQAEVGYPLAYYKTDRWIRVYLDGEFNNVIEAMEVFDDAWPIQYGN
mgnify:CR=1 FL=1